MSDLPISVSERVGGRARLPSLQNFLSMAQRCTEVTRKLNGRVRSACDHDDRSERSPRASPGENRKHERRR